MKTKINVKTVLSDVINNAIRTIDSGDNKEYQSFYNNGFKMYELFRMGLNSIVYDSVNNQLITCHGLVITKDITRDVCGEWCFAYAYYILPDNSSFPYFDIIESCLLDVSSGQIQ